MKPTIRQRDALDHIAENCRKTAELVAELTPEQLPTDWRAAYLLIHCVQIIGEAAGRLGDEFRSAYPAIPWRDILGMRNRLVHVYDEVDYGLLWRTVTRDVPVLLVQVENILSELS